MANKRIAVVASGWHYPLGFYEGIANQKLLEGWSIDLFCISHRDPKYAKKEKKNDKFTGDRAFLDERLYKKVLGRKDIVALGWNYEEYPNTIGDWGNSNQWLDNHNYKDYDILLFTHDDNLILRDDFFNDVIKDERLEEWGILANSVGAPKGWIRGSCEFFKPWVLEKMGGKFDLSKVSLTREGKTEATSSIEELYDWNNTVHPLMEFIQRESIPVGFLSPSYRVSAYCIEGERGYISNTHGQNTEEENVGINFLKHHGLI